MDRYICIHGHFYQPPRENPWLEDIETQDSAYPYHDWNDRIMAECYEPNTASRILTEEHWIRDIVNNYASMSYNFGPTLLSWMEKHKPEVYRAIIEADEKSRAKFSGHGSALAQCYNHMIMPLASSRDKYTQVVWGIRDFEHRFGRKPEGMWLPETAVDLETLEIMAGQGISFTILASYQGRSIREIGHSEWHDVLPNGPDTKMPYRVYLPNSDRRINVFFYNGDLSKAVAFEDLLANGERFANRLMSAFDDNWQAPQLVHIATDGETYGHHHRHGDMALAFALDFINANDWVNLVNYAQYLDQHPPTHEVAVNERTSWSCVHGVDRWWRDCGCNTGMHPGWGQAWRTPLREALDWLRDTVAPMYEDNAGKLLTDPWAARNDYVDVILDRSPDNVKRWLAEHSARDLNPEEQTTALKLLELQRHAMLMYTSCGWFFDEISGIENVQVLMYAGRVIQLAADLFGRSPEGGFLEILARAKSNIPEFGNGANVYESFVKPAMVDLLNVGAHYAICSLFEDYDNHSRIFCYDVEREDHQVILSGKAKLSLGKARITSQIIRKSAEITYGVANLGTHNIGGGVRHHQDEKAYQAMVHDFSEAFNRGDFPEIIRLIDQHFEGATYSLPQLFKDKQRLVLDAVLENTLSETAGDYRKIYNRNGPLMSFLMDLGTPVPEALETAARFVLNADLVRAFEGETLDLQNIKALLQEASRLRISLDGPRLSYVLEQSLQRMAARLVADPLDRKLVGHIDEVVRLVYALPFEVDLWKLQNVYHGLVRTVYPDRRSAAAEGDGEAGAWMKVFNALGDKLRVRRSD